MCFTKIKSLSFVLLLSACGFKPLYGPNSDARALKDLVFVNTISERQGQILRNRLVKMLDQNLDAPNTKAPYRLTIALSNNKSDMGLLIDDTSTFSQYSMTASYTLTEKNKEIFKKRYTSETSYNQGLSPISSLRNEEDAISRLTKDIATRIMRDISIAVIKP